MSRSPALRWVALVLVIGIDCVLLARPGGGRALVIAAGPPAARPAEAWDDPLAGLTADDVARGVWGLRRQQALTDEQQAVLRPLMAKGADQHAAISAARMSAREAGEARMVDQAELALELRERWPAIVPKQAAR